MTGIGALLAGLVAFCRGRARNDEVGETNVDVLWLPIATIALAVVVYASVVTTR